MGARAVDRARLESVCTARYRGFESLPIRHIFPSRVRNTVKKWILVSLCARQPFSWKNRAIVARPKTIAGKRIPTDIGIGAARGARILGTNVKNRAAAQVITAHCMKSLRSKWLRGSSKNGPASGQCAAAARASLLATLPRKRSVPITGLPNSSLAIGSNQLVSRQTEMLSQGTKKSRQNGPNTLMIPTLRPEGQTLRVRMLLMLTREPIEADWPRIRRTGCSSWLGNLVINRNQPDSTPRTVQVTGQATANGKKNRAQRIGE